MRGDVAGLGELRGRSATGWLGEPLPDRDAARIVVGRQLEVHAATLGDGRRGRPGDAYGLSRCATGSWCRGPTPTPSATSPPPPRRPGGTGCSCGSRCGASTRGSPSAVAATRTSTHPPRHDAHAAVAAPAVGAGQPGRHRRPAVGRAGDRCRSGSARSTAGSTRSARRSTGGSAPSCSTSASTSSPGCGPGQPFSYDGKHYTVAPTEFPTIGHTVQQPRVPIWCVGCSTGRSRWPGRCAGTACSRRSAGGEHPTLEQIARDPRAGRRPRLRHRHRGRGQRALPGGVGRGRGDVVDRVDVERRRRGRRRPRRQRPPPRRPAALTVPIGGIGPDAGWTRTREAADWRRDGRLELRRPVGGDRRRAARRPGAAPRRVAVDVAPSSTAAPTASPPTSSPPASSSRTRSPSTSTTGPSTSSRCSPRSRPGSPSSTPTTATPPTSSSTCGTTPTSSPSCSTARSPSACDDGPRPPAAHPHVAVGRRRHRAVPGLGDAVRGAAPAPWPGRTVAPWGRSGDHLLLLYTGGTTGMPKGVMWRQDDLFRRPRPAEPPPPAAARRRSTTLAARLDRPGPAQPAGGPADARHRAVQRHQRR